MLTFMDSAASAGGAHAKVIIGYNPNSKEIISGIKKELPIGFEHYLIKFDFLNDNQKSQDYTKLEYLYMNMAKEAKIEVPNIELLEKELEINEESISKIEKNLIRNFSEIDKYCCKKSLI